MNTSPLSAAALQKASNATFDFLVSNEKKAAETVDLYAAITAELLDMIDQKIGRGNPAVQAVAKALQGIENKEDQRRAEFDFVRGTQSLLNEIAANTDSEA